MDYYTFCARNLLAYPHVPNDITEQEVSFSWFATFVYHKVSKLLITGS